MIIRVVLLKFQHASAHLKSSLKCRVLGPPQILLFDRSGWGLIICISVVDADIAGPPTTLKEQNLRVIWARPTAILFGV